jgi:hypothetical protein
VGQWSSAVAGVISTVGRATATPAGRGRRRWGAGFGRVGPTGGAVGAAVGASSVVTTSFHTDAAL